MDSTDFKDPSELMTVEEEEKREKQFVDQLDRTEQQIAQSFLNKSIWGSKEMVMDIIKNDLKAKEVYEIYNLIGIGLRDIIGWLPSAGFVSPYFTKKLELYDKGDYEKSKSDLNQWYGTPYDIKDDAVLTKVVSKPVKEDYKDVSNLAHRIKIKLPSSVLVKIYYMMVEKPRLEWSAYLTYKDVLPSITDLVRSKMNEKKKDIIIDVIDMLFIPQHVSGGHVEGLELEYPEYMQDVYKVQAKGIKTTGRIHSHNTMGAFHSGTDNGEFKKNLEIDQSFFSVVVSLQGIKHNDVPFKEVERTQENILHIMNKRMKFHIKIGKPFKDDEIKYGVWMKGELDTIAIPKNTFKKNLISAYKFLNEYNNMMDIIDKTKHSFHLVEYFKEKKFMEFKEAREIRDMIIDNPTVLKIFNLYTRSITTVNQKSKKVDQEKKDMLKHLTNMADSMGYKLEDKIVKSKIPVTKHTLSPMAQAIVQDKKKRDIRSPYKDQKRVRLKQGSQSKSHVVYIIPPSALNYDRSHQCPKCKLYNTIVFNRIEGMTYHIQCIQSDCVFEWQFKCEW